MPHPHPPPGALGPTNHCGWHTWLLLCAFKISPGSGPLAGSEVFCVFLPVDLVTLGLAGFVTLLDFFALATFLAFATFFTFAAVAGLDVLLLVFAAACVTVAVAASFSLVVFVWERVDTMMTCVVRIWGMSSPGMICGSWKAEASLGVGASE